MGQFSREDDFPRCIVDNGYARGLAARINLDSVGCLAAVSFSGFQADGKGIAFENGGLPFREQDACSCRMNRIKRLFVGLEHKNV
jgi:hypothetical protein